MPDPTPRLALNRFAENERDWDYADTVEAVDELATERGPISERPASGDYDDEFYYAVDQDLLWRWDEAADDWVNPLFGAEGDRIPEAFFETLDAESADVDDLTSETIDAARIDLDTSTDTLFDATVGSTTDIDVSEGGVWELDADQNTEIDIAGTTTSDVWSVVIYLYDNGNDITFADTIEWEDGTPPDPDNETTILQLSSPAGTTDWLGLWAGGFA